MLLFRSYSGAALCAVLSLAARADAPLPSAYVPTQVLVARPDSVDPNQFGDGLAVGGDWAAIGNLPVSGSPQPSVVHVYRRTPDGWTYRQNLERAQPRAGDGFGASLATDGDTLLVGGRPSRSGGEESVSVFVRSGETWSEQATLRPAMPSTDDNFGGALALDGDTALVGAYSDANGAMRTGAVYVFVRSGGVWTEQARLVAGDGVDGAEFGWSVALDGDTAIIGADNDQPGGETSAGSAYVFTRSGATWTERAKLVADMPTAGGYFGISVALADDTAAVGELSEREGAGREGKVYFYRRSGDAWQVEARIGETATTGIAPAAATFFARHVALGGENFAVVSANHDRAAGVEDAGAVYVYTRGAAGWARQAKLESADPGLHYGFGSPLALAGQTLLVTEPLGNLLAQRPSRVTAFDNLPLSTQTRILDASPSIVMQGDEAVVRVAVTAAAGVPAGSVAVDDGHGNGCVIDLATTDRCTLRLAYAEPPLPPLFDPYAARLTATYAPSGPIAYLPSSGSNASVLVLYVEPPQDPIFADAFESAP